MKETVQSMRDNMSLLEERVQLMQDENDKLRKVLDEVREWKKEKDNTLNLII